jgi:integrase
MGMTEERYWLFATEAVSAGLPIHIAAKLLGHTDLNMTRLIKRRLNTAYSE